MTEFWQRGPIEGINPYLQPAAHAILQAHKETLELLQDFSEKNLWDKPEGKASVAFHLQHMSGVLDRLFTYARGQQLDPDQLNYLKAEGVENTSITLQDLLQHLDQTVDTAINQLKNTGNEEILEPREIGRKRIPSNTIGLLFHAAEHMQRHLGQLLLTVVFSK